MAEYGETYVDVDVRMVQNTIDNLGYSGHTPDYGADLTVTLGLSWQYTPGETTGNGFTGCGWYENDELNPLEDIPLGAYSNLNAYLNGTNDINAVQTCINDWDESDLASFIVRHQGVLGAAGCMITI